MAALVSLVSLGRLAAWVAMVIIARELAVTGLRAVAVEQGVVISASWLGKLKTMLQVAAVFALIIWNPSPTWVDVLVYLAVVVTVISGADYFFGLRRRVEQEREARAAAKSEPEGRTSLSVHLRLAAVDDGVGILGEEVEVGVVGPDTAVDQLVGAEVPGHQQVVARHPLEHVDARASDHGVVVRSADQRVVAGPTVERALDPVELTTLSFWSPAEDLDLGHPAGLADCRVVATSRAAGAGLDAGAAVRAGGEVGDLKVAADGRVIWRLSLAPGAALMTRVAPERPTAAVVTLIVRIAGLGSVFWARSMART